MGQITDYFPINTLSKKDQRWYPIKAKEIVTIEYDVLADHVIFSFRSVIKNGLVCRPNQTQWVSAGSSKAAIEFMPPVEE